MLNEQQLTFFRIQGYLVTEYVLDQGKMLNPVRADYAALLYRLIAGWVKTGCAVAALAAAQHIALHRWDVDVAVCA